MVRCWDSLMRHGIEFCMCSIQLYDKCCHNQYAFWFSVTLQLYSYSCSLYYVLQLYYSCTAVLQLNS